MSLKDTLGVSTCFQIIGRIKMTEQQKETAEYLTQQFLYWAQNNEMIDTEYLQHGKDLLTAVSLFEELK